MTKHEFLATVKEGLSCLSAVEVEERLGFLAEMIDDAMEEGLREEDAVLRIGAPDKIIAGILFELVSEERTAADAAEADASADTETSESITGICAECAPGKKRMSGGAITLIAVGSVVWAPLLIVAFAVGLVLLVSMWSVIVSLLAVFVSLAAAAPSGIAVGACMAFCENAVKGLMIIGVGVTCGGLAIFAFFGCVKVTLYACILMKKIFLWIRALFGKKEEKK